MAEFVEVMKALKRMCDCNTCKTCELESNPLCSMIVDPIRYEDDIDGLERAVMKWAKEHPEPKLLYPTFAVWQSELFPNARGAIRPCAFTYVPAEICGASDCYECAEQTRIPEDVAKQLGIKPKLEVAE